MWLWADAGLLLRALHVPPGCRLQEGGQRVSCPQASLPPHPSTCRHPAPAGQDPPGGKGRSSAGVRGPRNDSSE